MNMPVQQPLLCGFSNLTFRVAQGLAQSLKHRGIMNRLENIKSTTSPLPFPMTGITQHQSQTSWICEVMQRGYYV